MKNLLMFLVVLVIVALAGVQALPDPKAYYGREGGFGGYGGGFGGYGGYGGGYGGYGGGWGREGGWGR